MKKTRYKHWKMPEFNLPYISSGRENIIHFARNKNQSYFWLIGKVIKVEQGHKIDYVYMSVGTGYRLDYCKKLYVMSRDARKQIYTLTINQFAIVSGVRDKRTNVYNVSCFFPAYIPKITDRREILEDNNNDLGFDKLDEKQEEQDLQDILSEFIERND